MQASAADWTAVLLAGLRRRLAQIPVPGAGVLTAEPHLVFFQHDEVIVHTPAPVADQVVAAIEAAGREAGQLVFGATPVRFPMATAVVECYADAK